MKSINRKVSKVYQSSQSYSLANSVSSIYVVSILHFDFCILLFAICILTFLFTSNIKSCNIISRVYLNNCILQVKFYGCKSCFRVNKFFFS